MLVVLLLMIYSLVKYVRDQLVLAVALITKRSLFDVGDEEREAILVGIKQLLAMDADHAVRKSIHIHLYTHTLTPCACATVASPWIGFGQRTRGSILQHQIHHDWTDMGTPPQLQALFRDPPAAASV